MGADRKDIRLLFGEEARGVGMCYKWRFVQLGLGWGLGVLRRDGRFEAARPIRRACMEICYEIGV